MINDKLKLALRQMGYRPIGDGKMWGKPVAYHILIVGMVGEDAKITNYFIGIRDQTLVWDSHILNPDNYEDSIKMAEYSTKTNVGLPFTTSKFGFTTLEDRLSIIAEQIA